MVRVTAQVQLLAPDSGQETRPDPGPVVAWAPADRAVKV